MPIVRLDLELANSKIDVLKIDVEGADTWVLFGCEELLRKQQIGRIFFEQHPGRMELLGIKTGEAQKFLENMGYKCFPINTRKTEWTAFPTGISNAKNTMMIK